MKIKIITTVDSIIVTWVGGNKQVLTNQSANQLLTIEEIPEEEKPIFWYGLGVLFLIGLILLLFKTRK